jgi:RNA polymerase sigma-70 factor (ECF subfamily)
MRMDALLTEWLPVVLGWAARLSGPRVDAEDVAHDVFVVVLTRYAELRDPARLPAWLFGITRRVIAAHRRKAWVRYWTGGQVPDVEDRAPRPDERYQTSETARRVVAILERLPAKQREVLVLVDLEERSMPEVASLLEVPVGTVASRLRLARARFEKEVAVLAIAGEGVEVA